MARFVPRCDRRHKRIRHRQTRAIGFLRARITPSASGIRIRLTLSRARLSQGWPTARSHVAVRDDFWTRESPPSGVRVVWTGRSSRTPASRQRDPPRENLHLRSLRRGRCRSRALDLRRACGIVHERQRLQGSRHDVRNGRLQLAQTRLRFAGERFSGLVRREGSEHVQVRRAGRHLRGGLLRQ
jgi:hypothetical protein